MSRSIYIDDNDTRIQYTGSWDINIGSHDAMGSFGAPYLRTMHGTQSGGSLSYAFNGSYVAVFGSNTMNMNSPHRCFVDGESISAFDGDPMDNRQIHCEKAGMVEGPHVVTLNATNNNAYWFDFIEVIPSMTAPVGSAEAVFINSTDPLMQFGVGWTKYSPGYITTQTNSTFEFSFYGSSLDWYGFYDKALPFATTTSTYSIDGQPPITFGVNGVSAGDYGVMLNQILFQTGPISLGQHTLQVVYKGSPSTTPLSINGVLVQNGTVTAGSSPIGITSAIPTASDSSINSTPLPTFSSTRAHKHAKHTGIIVGCVIGGLLLVLAGVFILWMRKRQAHEIQLRETDIVEPFQGAPSVSRTHPPSSPPLIIPRRNTEETYHTAEPVSSGPRKLLSQESLRVFASPRTREQVPLSTEDDNQPSELLLVHEDSGLRLPVPTAGSSRTPVLVELPPTYSPR